MTTNLAIGLMLAGAVLGEVGPRAGGPPRPASAADAGDPGSGSAVDRLLEKGDLQGALLLLQPSALSAAADARTRATLIHQVLAAHDLALAYGQEDRAAKALAALNDVKTMAGVQSDLPLRTGVARLALALERKIFERDNDRARRMLNEADRLRDDDHFAEAIKLYDQVLTSKDSLTDSRVNAAQEGRMKAERGRVDAAGFWRTQFSAAQHAASTVLVWLLCFAGLGALAGLAVAIPRLAGPRRGVLLRVLDLTASGEAGIASSEQLAQSLRSRLTGSSVQASGRPRVDVHEDFDRAGLANLRLEAKETTPLESVIADSEPVKFGALSFSPRQLYRLVRGAFQRPFESAVVGTVVARGDRRFLTVQVRDHRSGASAQADTGVHDALDRQRMLDEAADFVVFRLAAWKASQSWASFRAYRAASRLLLEHEPERRAEVLAQACELLQLAVSHDPTNALARFRLALALRKLGRNVEAAAMLTQLVRELSSTELPEWLRGVVEANPGFDLTVRYNLAVTLAKIDDEYEIQRALEQLDQLIARTSDPFDSCDEQQRMLARVGMMARAGKAGVLLWHVERGRPDRTPNPSTQGELWLRSLADKAFAEIEEIRKALRAPDAAHELDLQGYWAALAVVENAYGRASYLFNRGFEEAESALIAALVANPGLACAHMNLAQVYHRHRAHTPGWSKLAEIHLREALSRSPRNAKAHFLLGLVYQDPSNPNVALAKQHLEASGPDPRSHLVLADLLARESDIAGARRLLETSVRTIPRPVDRRFIRLIELTARLPDEALTPEIVATAEEMANCLFDARSRAKLSAGEEEKVRALLVDVRARAA